MHLTLVEGRANSQKTARLSEGVYKCMRGGESAVLIVPEQATFDMENLLAPAFEGLVGVEVLSFSRLCERILSDSGRALPYLSRQGRHLVVRRCIRQCQKELKFYGSIANGTQFCQRMEALFNQFRQSSISPDQLITALDKLPQGSLLHQKLSDIQLIYAAECEYLSNRYMTPSDMQTAAIERMSSSFITESHIFIDGIDNPSNELFLLLSALISKSKSVTISLRIDPDRPNKLFAPDETTRQRLLDICARLGCTVGEIHCRKDGGKDELSFLEEHLFSDDQAAFNGDAQRVELYALSDRRHEAEYVADLVLKNAQSGTRYRDMAIVCPDLNLYGQHLMRAFKKRNIPLFYDAKKPLVQFAAAQLLIQSIGAVCNGYRLDCVLALLKSGYCHVPQSHIEIFENYILRYGLFASALVSPFSFGQVPPEAEQVRSLIMPRLIKLHEGLKQPTAIAKVQAILDYLNELGLIESLSAEADELIKNGNQTQAQQLEQINAAFLELFNQIVLILGDARLTMAELESLITEGLTAYELGSIPPASDCVLLGDIERSRIRSVDSLFIIGCNEGLIPKLNNNDALLNDADLKQMKDCSLSVWNNSKLQAQTDRLELYSIITKAKRSLTLCYACSEDGSTLPPSLIISRVRELLPSVCIHSDTDNSTPFPSCMATGFERLVREYRLFGQEGTHTVMLPALMAIYSQHEDYSQKLKRITNGELLKNSPTPLERELALRLYGAKVNMSASRLEQFNRCPFAHFENYGLKAQPRKEAREELTDTGTFIHDSLDAFVRYVTTNNLNWRELDDSKCNSIVDKILPDRIKSHHDGIFTTDVRLKESVFILNERIKAACRSIVKQIALGLFEPASSELAFGMEGGEPPLRLTTANGIDFSLRGKIDRVDLATVDGEKLLRIVDYKLGQRTLEPERVLSGETLQLPIYLMAAKQLNCERVGMYYMPISQPLSDDESQIQIHALNGLTANDDSTINATEQDMGNRSQYITSLKRDKNGTPSGAVCDREALDSITKTAARIACQTVDKIYSGEARVFPTKKACQYCPYLSVCRFDPILGGKKRFVPDKKLADLIEGGQSDAMD